VRIGVLGPLLAWSGDGRPVEVAGARLRALLVRLALDPAAPVAAATLVDDLWGAAPPERAANAVQSLVSRLRAALHDGTPGRDGEPAVVLEPGGYRLAPPVEVDAERFERLVAEGGEALAAGEAGPAAALLREALGLWRGPALVDVLDAPFATAPAARLEELRLAALEQRIEADLRLGRHTDAVVEAEALAVAHPLRERLRGLQMRALAGAGRQAAALAVYQATRRALAEELGVDPSPELEAVHLAVLRGVPGPGPGAAPGPAAGDADAADGQAATPRTNLRAQLTSFVGRDDEVRSVGELLARNRLVTLVGPGGAGKTRLAVESAAPLAGDLPGGAWLVELAGLQDPRHLPQAVLATVAAGLGSRLGARPAPLAPGAMRPGLRDAGPPVEDAAWRDGMSRLVDALAGRRLLVVLDNCEHLVEGAARLAEEALAACPHLLILATSREPLGVVGEALCPVGPLGLPPERATVADALAAPAVRLLADRTAAVRAGFAIGEDNLAAVVDVCRRLDGLPLAIELAAARLRSLPVEQVAARLADRLGDRFGLLAGGRRAGSPRQRTLRAVVDWSWDMLDEPERRVARRLAVVPGGATLACAEAVCAWGGLPRERVLGLLAELADKSLLVTTVEGGGRYRMLETVRAYAAERLAEAGEAAEARARHVRHFLDLAERAEPRLRSADQLVWLGRIRVEEDNLLAATRWAVEAGDAAAAVRLAVSLGWFWTLADEHAQAATVLREVLALGPEALRAAPPDLLVLAYGFHAVHTTVAGGPGSAAASFQAAIRLGRDLDRAASHPMARLYLLAVEAFGAYGERGVTGAAEMLAGAEDDPDPWVRTVTRLGRAMLLANLGGDHDRAAADLAAAFDGFGAIGDRWGMATAAGQLAEVRSLRGDHAGAADALERALGLTAELWAGGPEAAEVRARLSVERARAGGLAGGLAGARDDLERTLDAARRQGGGFAQAYALAGLAEAAELAGDLAGARRHYEEALATLDGGPPGAVAVPNLRASVLIGLGRLRTAAGDLAGAEASHRKALALATGVMVMPVAADAIDGLAGAAFGRGDAERAAALLGAAVAVRGAPNLGRRGVARLAGALRDRLGGAAYERAYGRGASMTRDAALAHAGDDPGAGREPG
jgi:predicted ATPase/DNA-binding SARP family transcriptional activator